MNDQRVELRIVVKPNAKHSRLLTVKEGVLHIALHARPKEGEANRELIEYLAKFFHLPKSKIFLQRGEKSRNKTVFIFKNEEVKKFLLNPSHFIEKIK